MIELSVGQVSGIIAAAIVFIQFVCPLVLTFLLAGFLRNAESATTWSVANQNIQSSLWPAFLRTDTWNPGQRVRPWIRVLSFALPVATLLTAIAGIVTPLGLDEEVISVVGQTGKFQYAKDTSPYADGTSRRGATNFHRRCSGGEGIQGPIPCPYTGDVVERTDFDNGNISWDFPGAGLTAGIPDILQEIFSSGTMGQATTISNFFDIEWRQLSTVSLDYYGNGTDQEVGLYRQLDSFILQDEYKVLEGLVVDARTGGIGFRNHTVPTGLSRGGAWTEDLLFIEPDVSCVNTNLTIDFEVSTNLSDTDYMRYLVLTDRGGFADLDTVYSTRHPTGSQDNPELQARAYEAAFLNNAYTMMIFNVTDPIDNSTGKGAFSYLNSEIGRRFALNSTTHSDYVDLDLSGRFGSYFGHSTSFEDYPNAHNISFSAFDDISSACTGVDGNDLASISGIYVKCGLLKGAPIRIDNGQPSIFDKGSKWSSSIHSCAAAVRATIKTVGFSFNATSNAAGLQGLEVTSIEPKRYANENDYPLWGFEEAGLNFSSNYPIWGLISDEYESHKNVSSVRQPHFYIPGAAETLFLPTYVPSSNNLAASDFAGAIMNQVFEINKDWPYDLRGYASISMFSRWQSLSSDPANAATIIRLLWTDLAASAVVGTKGALGHLNKGGEEAVRADVKPFARHVTYNLLYGIPAFLLLLFVAIMALAAIITIGSGRASIARLRQRIYQLSVGRIYTTYLFPKDSSLTMESSDWKEQHGSCCSYFLRYAYFPEDGEVPKGYFGMVVKSGRRKSTGGVPGEDGNIELDGWLKQLDGKVWVPGDDRA